MSGLTYFDLIGDELPISMSDKVSPFLIPKRPTHTQSSRPTMLIALSHGRKGSNGGAGSPANIRADINDDPLVLRSAMEQDYTNWHTAF